MGKNRLIEKSIWIFMGKVLFTRMKIPLSIIYAFLGGSRGFERGIYRHPKKLKKEWKELMKGEKNTSATFNIQGYFRWISWRVKTAKVIPFRIQMKFIPSCEGNSVEGGIILKLGVGTNALSNWSNLKVAQMISCYSCVLDKNSSIHRRGKLITVARVLTKSFYYSTRLNFYIQKSLYNLIFF